MVFISHLKLRNFKSFKAADIQLPKTFICFAGPNGSGKSNLCDAIRFVMGETSLRSLRAKRVKDLIHAESKSAEVTIAFQDDGNKGGGYELKRAIREDGKILYRLDGKKTTRSAILEAIKKYNLDSSGRNTIAQGEVQRIINMNGKERRVIIDSVAGITDFEDKKKEAMSELETVETRIKEANLVLGERRAFLEELKNEKETALKYLESKKTLTNAKATLLRNELKRLEKELSEVASLEEKINSKKAVREQEVAEIEARVREVEARRMENSRDLQAKQKTNLLIRKVEELRAACTSRMQLIEDREAQAKKNSAETEALQKELAGEHQNVEALRKELDGLRAELKTAEAKLGAQGGPAEDDAVSRSRAALERHEAELVQARERLIALGSDINSKKEILEAKKAEEKGINVPGGEEAAAAGEDTKRLRAEVAKIAGDIDASFARTKEHNASMAELDRQMLELKEKASIFKLRASPQLTNPALGFIADLKQKDKGIHGTVADLITFEPKYAGAVEAAAGSRLLYVVVDCVDTATAVIDKLKKAKAGRATFIPLDTVRAPPARKPSEAAGAGRPQPIIEVVEFPEQVRRAAEYVFAETLLVDTVADAKRLGIGSSRMVTLEGEIFERSGVVSGGRSESGILSGNQLRKLEKELSDTKAEKDALLNELYSIREHESALRAEKSQLELKMKVIEMELRMNEDRRKESAHLLKRKAQLGEEMAALVESLRSGCAEKEKLTITVADKEKAAATLREQLRAAEEGFRKHAEDSGRKRTDLTAAVSSLRATIEGKMRELELRRRECTARDERVKQLEKEGKTLVHGINDTRRQLTGSQEELGKAEAGISSASKEIEKLFEKMKEYEGEFASLGKTLAEKRIDIEKLNKDMNQLTVKRATATTHFDDITAESANYQDAQFLDVKKDELTRMVGESERILAELGNVNMAAIEMYDRKRQEIEEASERITRLDTERRAIMAMITEIEEHKKAAFFETFHAVSDNFSGMFKHINIGEGHLYLDKPATPFESGLFIKMRKNNSEYSLDALSGGEKTLVALMFIFAMQFFKPAPFYILDEVDAALDKPNSKNLTELIAKMTTDSQFIMVSHNDAVMSSADSVIGVAKVGVASKLVGIKLKQVAA
jgi:chromosome segregation protein